MTVRALGHRILYRLTRPPVAPARQLLIYYVLLALALAALVLAVPGAGQWLGVGRLAELAAASPRLLDDGARAAAPPPSVTRPSRAWLHCRPVQLEGTNPNSGTQRRKPRDGSIV